MGTGKLAAPHTPGSRKLRRAERSLRRSRQSPPRPGAALQEAAAAGLPCEGGGRRGAARTSCVWPSTAWQWCQVSGTGRVAVFTVLQLPCTCAPRRAAPSAPVSGRPRARGRAPAPPRPRPCDLSLARRRVGAR